MARILAVDWGERRVGLAISDPSATLARALPTLSTRSEKETVTAVGAVVRNEEVDELVVGLPLNMDGSHGEAAHHATALADLLKVETGLPTTLWDERLTSVQARRHAEEIGERIGRRKDRVDQLAAEILLQSFLDARRIRGENR